MYKFVSLFAVKRIFDIRLISNRLTADGKVIPKVKNTEDRITLISPDNSITITDIRNAQTLSDRRDLKLVKIQDIDSKTRRPVYKLMTSAEYHAEELQKRKEKQESRQNNSSKGEKLLSLSSKMGDHDLMTSVKKMMKLLGKQYEVRVVIAGEGNKEMSQTEKMYAFIEKNTKDIGKVVQKRTKGNSLRFQLLPSKDKSTDASSDNSSSNNSKDHKGPL